MKQSYPAALAAVLKHEGGFSNHPLDKGGATNRGITQAVYSAWLKARGRSPRSVRSIKQAEVEAIYRKRYWDKCRCDDLPAGVDYAVFDAAVNSGPTRAAKWLQAALAVETDGKIGPVTLAAARDADPVFVIHQVFAIRLAFLRQLKTWPTFGKGWARRIDEGTVFALRLTEGQKGTASGQTLSRPVALARPIEGRADPVSGHSDPFNDPLARHEAENLISQPVKEPSPMSTPEKVTVPVKPAWHSKINWISLAGPFASLVSGLIAAWGFDLSPEQILAIIAGIQSGQSVVTILLRTFWTRSVTPASVGK